MKFTNSKTSEIFLNNQRYFVKRDDLLHSDFSGNKARKFYYFLKNDLQGIEKLYLMAQINQMQCTHYLFYVN